ncbi:alpha/beta hydrolase [Limibaculum sp. M0105]|uniref:Alpha/beta hydrolase n=1 Tax=Thermohalobaculum xanthum TaxID=2753746 RepID=A0A8J7M982_9RHOB|nr:alpha/beta hydrolase [Thermohalobaculum xanthum]MBK0401036.1 alpha/beta hydrolase [Thermohalobaculum xanthum]
MSADAPRRFASADGRRIAYDVAGDGPAVLCLPGLTRSMRDFEPIAAHLASRHRVLRMDYRGRGGSDWAEAPCAEYTPMVEGGDAALLLAHLGIARTAILGTSRGGLIGMGLAAKAPAMVSCLILNDVGPVIEPAGIEAILGYLGRDPGFPDFDAAAAGLHRAHAASFPDLDRAAWLAQARRIFRDEGGRPALDYDPRLREAVEAALAAGPADLWPLFDEIEVPILVLRGANSEVLSPATLAQMQARKPGLVAVTVPDRGHVPFLDEPVALAAIDTFLAEHAA